MLSLLISGGFPCIYSATSLMYEEKRKSRCGQTIGATYNGQSINHCHLLVDPAKHCAFYTAFTHTSPAFHKLAER